MVLEEPGWHPRSPPHRPPGSHSSPCRLPVCPLTCGLRVAALLVHPPWLPRILPYPSCHLWKHSLPHLSLHPLQRAVVPLSQLPDAGGGLVARGLIFLPLGPGPSCWEALRAAVPAPMLPICSRGTESQSHPASTALPLCPEMPDWKGPRSCAEGASLGCPDIVSTPRRGVTMSQAFPPTDGHFP